MTSQLEIQIDRESSRLRLRDRLSNDLLANLRHRRRRLDDELARRDLAHTFSLARDRLHRKLAAAIDEHAHGDCLDAGSGRSPYRRLLAARGTSVLSIDIKDCTGRLDMIADIQDLHALEDGSFDTILCSQVLEHVPRPWDAVRELARVLRPGGRLLLTVPHLSMIHEAPHDYYRYTRYGLRSLCERAELTVESIPPTGGLLCFLSHNASVVWMSTFGSLPGMMWLAWFVNYLLLVRLIGVLDRVVGAPSIYPCDYLLVACKPLPDEMEAAR